MGAAQNLEPLARETRQRGVENRLHGGALKVQIAADRDDRGVIDIHANTHSRTTG